MPDDIDFDSGEFLLEPETFVVRESLWSLIYSGDYEKWGDGFLHPIYVAYCKVKFEKYPKYEILEVEDFIF